MKKAELVEAMLAEDERLESQEKESAAKTKSGGAVKREEKQQVGDGASKTVRKKTIITNFKPSAPVQERGERQQNAVMNESSYRAETMPQSDNSRRTEETVKTDLPFTPRPDAAVQKMDGFRGAPDDTYQRGLRRENISQGIGQR